MIYGSSDKNSCDLSLVDLLQQAFHIAKGGLGSRTGHDGGGGDWSVGWWAPIQTTSRRGVDLFSFFLIYQGGAQDSQKLLETEE